LRPNERLYEPFTTSAFGSQNHALDTGIETTYGYNPLHLRRYQEYLDAAAGNPRLLDVLAVTVQLNVQASTAERVPSALPLATFPGKTLAAKSGATLQELDPAVATITEAEDVPTDASSQVLAIERSGNEYRIRYRAARDALLRLAVPFFPGWTALTDGKELRVFPVDRALLGIVVPAGERIVTVRFRPRYFGLAAFASGAAFFAAFGACAALGLRGRLRPVPPSGGEVPDSAMRQ
jgi:hypothetical protein